ncbi:hypothetical protein SNE40_013690 [Patella caerulea]
MTVMTRRWYIMESAVFILLGILSSPVLAVDTYYDLDRLSTCNREVTIFDEQVVLNGRSNAAPANPPKECTIYIKSGYTDGKNRLQVDIETIAIEDCAVFVDLFNGRGAYGNSLKRLGCSSQNKDSLYSDKEWITVQFQRPTILYQTAYVIKLTVKTYEDPDVPGILLGGTTLPPGAIIGIIVGLLAILILAGVLIWCWRSGRLTDYIGFVPNDKQDEELKKDGKKSVNDGEDNRAIEKSDKLGNGVGVIKKTGIDHQDPKVWNTITSGKYDPNGPRRTDGPQFLGRSSYRDIRPRKFDDDLENRVIINNNENSDPSASWQKGQTDLKKLLNNEIRQGQGSRGRGQSVRGEGGDSKETLIDDVFESDDNKNKDNRLLSHGGDDAYENVATPHYLKKKDSGNEFFKRGDPTRGSSRRGEDGSPTRGSLRRGDTGRGSNKSTGSHQDDMNTAKNLADEATAVKLKSSKSQSGPGGPPSDFDSSSFMSVPEPETVVASVHGQSGPGGPSGQSQKPTDDTSDDSELNEINCRAKPGESEMVPNPNLQQNQNKDAQKSPNSKKRKKKKPKKEEVKDTLPPEAFEPLFDRPVSEEPYPAGMQPLNAGYNPYGIPGAMYPLQQYGMPYGMMPAPGTVPPGTQTYAYAYQTMPAPGAHPNMAPQQMAGKAAWIVQETPTKNGPVQKTSFMMATQESQPGSHQKQYHNQSYPHGSPGQPYTSTPYGETPHGHGSGRRKSKPRNPADGNNTSVVPAGVIPPDNGQGHRTAMMKSGVDPVTGIETNQVLWTDTTRDPSDPPPGANPQITRKTVIRTTTRSGYGELPETADEITDHLYLEIEPHDQPFLSPSKSGPHSITANSTPDRDNLSYYLGRRAGSSQQVIHPAPSRNKAIRDSVSIA